MLDTAPVRRLSRGGYQTGIFSVLYVPKHSRSLHPVTEFLFSN
ncbi:hypothetical protein GPLA_0834 [Paraglaciecola polaris LMG 21857]|uniref:Uncharacterized protein n=1 Tax=Paraglaciecola polaris LMG 21857 TaxID=1129793 RepID=K7A8J5_9ALTE|nr:hypothetical protein GPLA_0834 [Paraglaciecola polaris LMG 21857]